MSDPAISVVVPTCGRPAALGRCLAALARTSLRPAQLEIVVVGDGASVAPPPEHAAGDISIAWRSQARRGPAAARNLGARCARAEVLAFTDDDCVPTAGWAEGMLASVRREPRAIVAGRVRNGLPRNRWAAASHLVLDTVGDLYNGRAGVAGFAPSSNLAVRRELFLSLGGFDERFTTAAAEDRELCDRYFAAGHGIVLAPAAVVDHVHDLDLRGFLRQAAAYGRGEVTYRAICRERGRPANVVEDRFYRQLALSALGLGPRRGGGLLLRVAVNQAAFVGSARLASWRARR